MDSEWRDHAYVPIGHVHHKAYETLGYMVKEHFQIMDTSI